MSARARVRSQSHPAIRFKSVPIVPGPLSGLEASRGRILGETARRTLSEFEGKGLDLILGEALYGERLRIKRNPGNLFTRSRTASDRSLWGGIQGGLLKPVAEVDRRGLLDQVVRHYCEEIGGHFDPRVYGLATRAVPWGFSWLLNAASMRRFLPWGMTESLQSRLRIVGEVPFLQNLSKRGTILLVPTHQSNIDSVLIGYVIYLMQLPPFAYGAGLNLFSNPVLNYFMSRLGAYTVDRQKTNAVYKSTLKNYSTLILEEGMHSIFFPGGTRSRSGAIESRLKLGLLGTGLAAQVENLRAGKPKPLVYVVPMVTSYHFVLEAASLIETHLAEAGKERFIIKEDEGWDPSRVLSFFWKLFSSKSGITVRIGKPMDVFGNPVDEEGRSLGPNGTVIDPARWLTTCGELRAEPQRDREYTRELGVAISRAFHRENTVITSHAVAFAFFEALRRRYPELDLFRFLRLSLEQRSIPYQDFLREAEEARVQLRKLARAGRVHLSEGLEQGDTDEWVRNGVRSLGLLHGSQVVGIGDGAVWTDDMNLLYYYRNRLTGYGLSPGLKTDQNAEKDATQDSKGFLV